VDICDLASVLSGEFLALRYNLAAGVGKAIIGKNMSDPSFKTRMMRSISAMSMSDMREELYRAFARERQVRHELILLSMQIEDLQELLELAHQTVPVDTPLHREIIDYLSQAQPENHSIKLVNPTR
jgi:hypothetical protein